MHFERLCIEIPEPPSSTNSQYKGLYHYISITLQCPQSQSTRWMTVWRINRFHCAPCETVYTLYFLEAIHPKLWGCMCRYKYIHICVHNCVYIYKQSRESRERGLKICVYILVYIYAYISTQTHVYMYIYIYADKLPYVDVQMYPDNMYFYIWLM